MFDTFVKIVGMIATAIAIVTFWRTVRLKRAEWLYQLHAKFYESPTYKRIRHILDYQPNPDYSNLRLSVTTGGHDELAEALVDYLNFFEFIAALWKLNQLSLHEVAMMFEYYVLNLTKHDFVMTFVQKEGFENLTQLIQRMSNRQRKLIP